MRFDFLAEPISEDDPCGPDLDEEGDNAYLNYVLLAGSRLPDKFILPNGQVVDRAGIDVDPEAEAVAGFLERTRDIRLLTLEARFQALNGGFAPFCDCIEGIATLVTGFWEHFHPGPADMVLRSNALGGLDGASEFILPLQYLPIVRGNRQVMVSYRRYAVAIGEAAAREEEEVVSLEDIARALGADENRGQVVAVHEALQRALEALDRIAATSQALGGPDGAVRFDRLPKTLREIGALIARYVPGLSLAEAPEPESEASTGADGGPISQPATRHDTASPIQSRADAVRALECIEAYCLASEPSSMAMVLVHQARMLEGRPLVEVIEALAPEQSERALLKLDASATFRLDMTRMRAVTQDAVGHLVAGPDEEAPNPAISAASREEAGTLMAQVEAFYRAMEPSSPIPLLLAKARLSLNRDFSSILNELLPGAS